MKMSRYKLQQKEKKNVTNYQVISQIGTGSNPESIFSLSDNK